VDAGWLTPVLECRQPGRELRCINAACVRYAVSVRPKEFACLFDCDRKSLAVCMTVGGSHKIIFKETLLQYVGT
jgi:hypothetical protein